MKKGFTLTEMAIVLVVIGLLAGMAMKGKSLVESARMKSDITKINKMSAAAATYNAKHGSMPSGTSSREVLNSFIKDGLISTNDMKLMSFGKPIYIKPYRCIGGVGGMVIQADNSRKSAGLCATFANTEADLNNMTINGKLSKVMVCSLESSLDDMNLNTGSGRLSGAKNSDNNKWNADDKWDCESYGAEEIFAEQWIYKLFL